LVIFLTGRGGGRFAFRFNRGPRARCALRLGEGPRALGFSIWCKCCALATSGATTISPHWRSRAGRL